MTFLELNGILIECSDDELVQLGLEIAKGRMMQNDICTWLAEHIEN